ncbi:MAG: hypothetical protein Q8N51_04440, partial [Gammaproteobacteria bacterium]|nr:hypothetical protein [Gammaproteobacteria bacterium]
RVAEVALFAAGCPPGFDLHDGAGGTGKSSGAVLPGAAQDQPSRSTPSRLTLGGRNQSQGCLEKDY